MPSTGAPVAVDVLLASAATAGIGTPSGPIGPDGPGEVNEPSELSGAISGAAVVAVCFGELDPHPALASAAARTRPPRTRLIKDESGITLNDRGQLAVPPRASRRAKLKVVVASIKELAW
jgi:hypothetical protein